MLDSLKKVVFFGAHSDDEFVAAGTLHKLAKRGCAVNIVTIAPAATLNDRTGTQESVQVVLPEWHASLDTIGVSRKNRTFLEYTPSADLHKYRQEICQFIYNFCEREKPDAVFTLDPNDENPAHSLIGIESERVMRGRVPIAIRCPFPWNYTLGRNNLFVSLEPDELEVKRKVIQCYASQRFRYRYEEMLLAFCVGNGLSVKREAAEVFEIVRMVVS